MTVKNKFLYPFILFIFILLIMSCSSKMKLNKKLDTHWDLQSVDTLYIPIDEEYRGYFLNFKDEKIVMPKCNSDSSFLFEHFNQIEFKDNFVPCNEFKEFFLAQRDYLQSIYQESFYFYHLGKVEFWDKAIDVNAFFITRRSDDYGFYAKGYPFKKIILVFSKNDTITSLFFYDEYSARYSGHGGVDEYERKTKILDNKFFFSTTFIKHGYKQSTSSIEQKYFCVSYVDEEGYFQPITKEENFGGNKFPRPYFYSDENDSLILVK